MINRRDILKLFGASAAIPAVKSVEQLQIKPEDAVVLKFDGHLSPRVMENIRKDWKEGFGGKFADTPLIILEAGADISVLRKA